ncbi:MAG: CRISPR locus-related DNA-binding protein [Candidatus Aenigmarchaeota archaeon]|nr:CRISPR locus-related DNA-binding protein [Candidatus Aenigmarchaeota archaeon]
MSSVLLSTIYDDNSVVFTIKKFDIDKVLLLVDKNPNAKQSNSIKSVREPFDNLIEIREEKIDVYNILDIVKKVVDIIDSIPEKDKIFVNISPGRKPQILGVIFAAYQRLKRINKIVYITEEKKDIVVLPMLSFDLTDSQIEILKNIEKIDSINKLEKKLEIGRAMIYRNIKDLQNKGFIEKDDKGLKLTDAGKIALL